MGKKLNRIITVNLEIEYDLFREIFANLEHYGLWWAEDLIVFNQNNEFTHAMIKDNEWHYLTRQSIVNAYQQAIDENILSHNHIIPENVDIPVVSRVAQLALFGEIRHS